MWYKLKFFLKYFFSAKIISKYNNFNKLNKPSISYIALNLLNLYHSWYKEINGIYDIFLG